MTKNSSNVSVETHLSKFVFKTSNQDDGKPTLSDAWLKCHGIRF